MPIKPIKKLKITIGPKSEEGSGSSTTQSFVTEQDDRLRHPGPRLSQKSRHPPPRDCPRAAWAWFLLFLGTMKSLQKTEAARKRMGDRGMADGLNKALENKYSRILRTAGTEWDRRFAGRDPSDACVSVRISPWGRTLSGSSTSTPRELPSFS